MLAGLENLHIKWNALGFVDGPRYKAVVPHEGFELGRYGPVVNFRTEAKLLAPDCPLRGKNTPLWVGEIDQRHFDMLRRQTYLIPRCGPRTAIYQGRAQQSRLLRHSAWPMEAKILARAIKDPDML